MQQTVEILVEKQYLPQKTLGDKKKREQNCVADKIQRPTLEEEIMQQNNKAGITNTTW